MSDLKGIEVSDLFGISQPLIKLFDCISNGIGKVYEPTHIKKMAKAKSEEIRMISDAVSSNIKLPMQYSNGELIIDALDSQELIKRTGDRIFFQEIQKQKNIEAVISNAYQELEKETSVSEEKVDDDWILRFFNSVEDISNEEMLSIWGKILAGEIKKPQSYSLRTLEKLKNISQKEAALFEKIANQIIMYGGIYFVSSDMKIFEANNCSFNEILQLEECGLMSSQSLSFKLNLANNQKINIYNDSIIGIISSLKEEKKELIINMHNLTQSGIQLYKVIEKNNNTQYAIDFFMELREKSDDYTITVHSVNHIKDDKINYNSEDLLPSVVLKA